MKPLDGHWEWTSTTNEKGEHLIRGGSWNEEKLAERLIDKEEEHNAGEKVRCKYSAKI